MNELDKKGNIMKSIKLYILLGVLSAIAVFLGLTATEVAAYWPPGGIGGP